jgi:hypothetical protein
LPDKGFGRPHSHSIIPRHRNALILRHKFFWVRPRTDYPIRQKFALLISRGNFGDSKSAQFQRLSASIGRFLKSVARAVSSASPRKDRHDGHPDWANLDRMSGFS